MNDQVGSISKVVGITEVIGIYCGFEFGIVYKADDGWQLCVIGKEKVYNLDPLHSVG